MSVAIRPSARLRTAAGSALAALSLVALAPVAAHAAIVPVSDRSVTVAARYCPDFAAVQANIARNGLQESLEDLGADSSYPAAFPVNPATEDANQASCSPMVGWRFTLGTGISGGSPADLSVVTSAYDTDVVTTASVPELMSDGTPRGSATVAGAQTVALTEAQAARALQTSRLWIQGGVPSPRAGNVGQLNGEQDTYAFASLRCGTDARNADNVEWLQLAGDVKHVFCYAYYVDQRPYGSITISKAADGGADTTFSFSSNLAYGNDGDFTLKGGASTSFVRAVASRQDPYTVSETDLPAGWELAGIACTTALTGSAASVWTVDAATVSIALTDGDDVRCTFTNSKKATPTPTPTDTGTPTPTPTESGTTTPTPTPTETETGTTTPTPTSTPTETGTTTGTPTATPTEPTLPDTGSRASLVAPAGVALLLLGAGLVLLGRPRGRHS